MARIVFTKDEARLLEQLAKARGQTPGELLRYLVLREALDRRLLRPDSSVTVKAGGEQSIGKARHG